jgi:hypothetical protein
VLYPSHRELVLEAPVFILAPPRTGSTSLHRALVSDDSRFFAPLVLELFFPFITVQRALHAIQRRPLLRKLIVDVLIGRFVRLMGFKPGEVAQRHPMGLFKEDEDDIGLTARLCFCMRMRCVDACLGGCVCMRMCAWGLGLCVHPCAGASFDE